MQTLQKRISDSSFVWPQVADYMQMYVDRLAEENPSELKRLHQTGELLPLLMKLDEKAINDEVRLTREMAEASLGKRLSDESLDYMQKLQALNAAQVSAVALVTRRLVEMAQQVSTTESPTQTS
jgi:hypothetical protein